MKEKSLSGRRVLITGISGFVGSHLARKLRSLGADVYGISRSIEGENKILKASILDFSIIDEFIKKSKIETCFHLAGESLVEAGQKDPHDTFRVNIEGTLNILESARQNRLERIIIASTAHVYGNNKLPYFEKYTPKPSRPYETSKACMDLIAQSYTSSFNLPVLIPRFVNIYGPGDLHLERLIPKTIRAVLFDKSPVMWGGAALRDYLYIDDAIDAYLRLAVVDLSRVGNNPIFNFGSVNRISVKELMEKIIQLSGKKLPIRKVEEQRSKEIEEQYVSFNKATKLLKWRPKTILDQGLKKTILWYSRYFAK